MAEAKPAGRDWQVGKSLTDCLQHMLEEELDCDVTFEIQSQQKPNHNKISAHKMILRARSPVFEAMFSGAFAEIEESVIVTDIESFTFRTMLRYMYTDEVTLTSDNVVQVLYAADKYYLQGLSEQCEAFVDTQKTIENVCTILVHSINYRNELATQKCLDFIATNIIAVSKTDGFHDMSHDALVKVVHYDQLAAAAEADIFAGCLEWGKRRATDEQDPKDEEIRELLGDCLQNIRFPFIPPAEFAMRFGATSVLSEAEKNLILCFGLTQDPSYSIALAARGFDISSRMMHIQRYVDSATATSRCLKGNSPCDEEFAFSVNKPTKLMGFSIYGNSNVADCEVTLVIHDMNDNSQKRSDVHTFRYPGDGKHVPILIAKLFLDPETNYKVNVSVSVSGPREVGWCRSFSKSVSSGDVVFTSSVSKWAHSDKPGGILRNYSFVREILFQHIA